jgi:hypothetical protein
VADGACLESMCRATYRGFESLPLRRTLQPHPVNLCVPSGERVRPQLGFVLFLDGAIEDSLDH